MIVPRIRYFSDLQARKMITKLTEKLDKDRIGDYEVSSKIPNDVISIYPDPSSIKIYIPKDLEYSQYEIDDFIRSMAAHIRTITILERDIYVMKLSGSLTFEQIYKLIREIIDTEEFCTIIDCD